MLRKHRWKRYNECIAQTAKPEKLMRLTRKNDQPNDKIIGRALSRWEKKRKKQKF